MKIFTQISAITIAIMALAPASWAQQTSTARKTSSSGTRGGGRTVGNMIYDLYQEANSTPVDSKELEDFTKVVEQYLGYVRKTVPGFAKELEASLDPNRREWVFVEVDLQCDDRIAFKVDADVIACQGDFKIRIQKNRFAALPIETKGHILFHEMVRFAAIEHNLSDNDSVYDIVTEVFKARGERPLQELLKRRGYGKYKTFSEEEALSNDVLSAKAWFVQKVEALNSKLSDASISSSDRSKFGAELMALYKDVNDKWNPSTERVLIDLYVKMSERTYALIQQSIGRDSRMGGGYSDSTIQDLRASLEKMAAEFRSGR